MPLQKQTARLNMGLGLDTHTDAKVLSSGKMIVLQNAKFTTGNRLSKRDGFAAVGVPDGGNGTIQRLATVNGTVIGWGNPTAGFPRSIYTYNKSITTPTFLPIAPGSSGASIADYIPACNDFAVTISPIANSNAYTKQADSASVNGFTIYGYTVNDPSITGTGAMYEIVDQATGNVVVSRTLAQGFSATTVLSVRCIANGGSLMVGVAIGPPTFGWITVFSINTTAAFATTSHTFPTFGVTSSVAWDWSSHTFSGTTGVFLAYQSSTNTVKVALMNSLGVSQATASYTIGALTIASLCCVSPVPATTSTTMRVVVGDTASSLHYAPFNVSLTAGTLTASATTTPIVNYPRVIIGQELSTPGASQIFVTSQTTNVYNQLTSAWSINASGTFSLNANNIIGGFSLKTFGIYSKPIYVSDNQIYFWTLYPSTIQGQFVMFQWGPGSFYPAARVAAGVAVGDVTVSTTAYGGTSLAVNTYAITTSMYGNSALVVNNQFTANGVVQQNQVSQLVSDFTFGNSYHVTEQNNQSIIAGGFNAMWDGGNRVPFELGYFTYPEYLTASGTAGGSMSLTATYQYIAMYEWSDVRGNVHESETSVPVTVTLSGTQAAAVVSLGGPGNNSAFFPPCTLKGFLDPTQKTAKTVFYRTTGNANPLIFYRVGDDSGTGTGKITDTLADSAITANQIIYTQGGIADNFTVDGTTVICAGPDRLFAADPKDNGIIHVGKPYTETVGLSFFAGITIQIPSEGGPVTNMLYMDSTLVAFKARMIIAVQGQGPTANGQNNGYAPAQVITRDVGCDNPHAATTYPDGILFKSAKGYYKLGRDLSFSPQSNYIGAGVEGFNSSSCLRAMCREDRNEARFLLSDNATILVYNYLFGQWSTIITSATDMTETNGSLYVSSNTPSVGALVAKETVGTFTDALLSPTGIPFMITTGWVTFDPLQDCQRVYRVRFLGDSKSTHTLQVEFAYDYEGGDSPTFAETHQITSANATFGSSAWQCEAFPLRQKCESIAIRISDPSPTGESFDITDIELEVGVLPGKRFPLNQNKGF